VGRLVGAVRGRRCGKCGGLRVDARNGPAMWHLTLLPLQSAPCCGKKRGLSPSKTPPHLLGGENSQRLRDVPHGTATSPARIPTKPHVPGVSWRPQPAPAATRRPGRTSDGRDAHESHHPDASRPGRESHRPQLSRRESHRPNTPPRIAPSPAVPATNRRPSRESRRPHPSPPQSPSLRPIAATHQSPSPRPIAAPATNRRPAPNRRPRPESPPPPRIAVPATNPRRRPAPAEPFPLNSDRRARFLGALIEGRLTP